MENTLLFNTRDELTRIQLDRVMYFESDANYTNVMFANGAHATLLTSLVKLEDLISQILLDRCSVFVRIGKKYIVNSDYIFQINVLKQRLILSDLKSTYIARLEVSKEALKKLKALFLAPIAKAPSRAIPVTPRPMTMSMGQATASTKESE